MEITPLVAAGRQVIQSYGKGGFRVSGRDWRGGILVLPENTFSWPFAFGDLSPGAFEAVRDAEPPIEILLIGTGARMALLPAKLKAELRAFGFGVETMDTGAACRTYNVLLAEERRVAAALLPVG